MDEQTFRVAAERDARVTAAAVNGRVTSDAEEFAAWIEEAAARRAVRDADSRTVEQIRAEVGELHQRCHEALWYGTRQQVQQAADAFARAMQQPSAERLYVHAAAVSIGDYVRVVGYDADDARDAASGVVEEVTYTEREIDPYGFGEPDWHCGFAFTVTPVVRTDMQPSVISYDIWMRETGSPEVLKLPAPVDRGRPAWLDDATVPVDVPGPAAVANLNFADEPTAPTAISADAPPSQRGHQRHRHTGR